MLCLSSNYFTTIKMTMKNINDDDDDDWIDDNYMAVTGKVYSKVIISTVIIYIT